MYIVYYVFIARFIPSSINRIPGHLSAYAVGRQFLLQVITFIDSTIGPSMWLKIYYSFFQLSLPSVIIGIIAVFLLYKFYNNIERRYDRALIIGLAVMAVSSFTLFAITGYYPQLAFNLGNRVTIFGSLLLAYLIILIPLSKRSKTMIFSILFFCILGISDHWKAWDLHQRDVMKKITDNADLKGFKGDLYVSGNQYSKFGPLSHIEYFSEEETSCIFEMLLGKGVNARSLNKRCKYEDGFLIDTKYDEKTKVKDYINVYDSEKDKFFRLDAKNINKYIGSLPDDKRHWVQLCAVDSLKKLAVRLMPRLKYAL